MNEKIDLRPIGSNCKGGSCETAYVSADGRYFIQGKVVGASVLSEVTLPEGESIVEISRELIDVIKGAD